MACLLVTFNSEEIDRRDLCEALVIGRSPECELGVRDILLSRRHCRIEPSPHHPNTWVALDLASKNGTLLNGRPLKGATVLCDGDELVLGRVRIIFGAERLADLGLTPLKCPSPRPVDPTEAMSGSGTFVGVGILDEDGKNAPIISAGRLVPKPRPQPKAPAAYEREDVYSLLTALASSSWDSIYAEASKPRSQIAAMPQQRVLTAPRMRPRSPIDLSLQARISESKPAATWRRLRIRRPNARAVGLCLILMVLTVIRFWPTAATMPAPSFASVPVRVSTPAPARTQPPVNLSLAGIQTICAALPLLL